MPEDLVRAAVLEHGGDAGRLADRFDVSRKAMQARLHRLGIGGHHPEHAGGVVRRRSL